MFGPGMSKGPCRRATEGLEKGEKGGGGGGGNQQACSMIRLWLTRDQNNVPP